MTDGNLLPSLSSCLTGCGIFELWPVVCDTCTNCEGVSRIAIADVDGFVKKGIVCSCASKEDAGAAERENRGVPCPHLSMWDACCRFLPSVKVGASNKTTRVGFLLSDLSGCAVPWKTSTLSIHVRACIELRVAVARKQTTNGWMNERTNPPTIQPTI